MYNIKYIYEIRKGIKKRNSLYERRQSINKRQKEKLYSLKKNMSSDELLKFLISIQILIVTIQCFMPETNHQFNKCFINWYYSFIAKYLFSKLTKL